MDDHIEQFRMAIQNAGMCPPEVIEADGRVHRFASNGKPRDTAAWYAFHADAAPVGVFGDWRTGARETWRADAGRTLSPQESAAHAAHMRAMRQSREEARAQCTIEARGKAVAIWRAATPAPDGHQYLVTKGVKAHGLRIHDGALVVPLYDAAQLQSLQFIAGDGSKRFLTGGRVRGCSFLLGTPGAALYVAEGYATAATIHEATGDDVAVAFNAGNLLAVAQALRRQFPDVRLIICADDDVALPENRGLIDARRAAQAVSALVAVPDFGATRPDGATDFNDLRYLQGTEAVRACLERAAAVTSNQASTSAGAAVQVAWREPYGLDRGSSAPDPFPLDALPGAIGAAVREYQAYAQQPISLVASSALATVSLAAQGLADVARDERLIGPISLNFLVVAQSGERKTAADHAFGAVLDEWKRARTHAMCAKITGDRARLDAWIAEDDGLKAAIKAAMRKNPDEVESLRQRLVDHAAKKPAVAVAPRLRYEDVNPQSLAFMPATGYPSAALWSDEGGMVTGSLGMGNDSLVGFMAELNRLWDGGVIHHDRKQAQSVHLEGRRLTVSLMVQPAVLRELAQRSGGLTRGSGFLARYLVTQPLSTMGTRLYAEPPCGMPCLIAFHERIRELLDADLPVDDQGRLCPPALRLTADAFSIWRDYHDEIEVQLKALGDYASACDFAAKSAENAARLAGCLHVFGGAQGEVSKGTMQRATTLARWYLREALRTLEVLEEPQAWAEARLLDGWLAEKGDTSPRDIQRLGTGPLRDKARRDAATRVLIELGRAQLVREGRRETLMRNPALRSLATATVATVATDNGKKHGSVAKVATVAVAADQSLEIERGEL